MRLELTTYGLQDRYTANCATPASDSFRVLTGSKRFVDKPTVPLSSRMFSKCLFLVGRMKTPNSGPMATPAGLEPAISAVTGLRDNQLRYGAIW